jgi:hypothetical protein
MSYLLSLMFSLQQNWRASVKNRFCLEEGVWGWQRRGQMAPKCIHMWVNAKTVKKRCLVSFIKFIPRYFIIFEAIVNGIISLISFSVCSFLAYKKATDFYMSILYPATLLNEFMISYSLLVEFLESLRYKVMSSANRDSLNSSFPIYIPFISCSCLIALARNSKTILNRSGKSGQPCLIPDFYGNDFSCPPCSMMLALDLSYINSLYYA